MRILGIDPGYATTGFGILQAERASVQLINYGTIFMKQAIEGIENHVVKKYKSSTGSDKKAVDRKSTRLNSSHRT